MILFPQLPHHIALALAESARAASIEELAAGAATEHIDCQYTPTGGSRATKGQLGELRVELLQIAAEAGYPGTPRQEQAARFDSLASVALGRRMKIAAAEAAKGGVWEFVSCILLADLVRWRFAGDAGLTSVERFVSGRRNTFQRLWWRSYSLSQGMGFDPQQLTHLLADLGEDELVQLMERPSLAGIAGLTGGIAQGLLAASSQHSWLTRRQLIREAQKRFLRLSSFLSLESLEPGDIRSLVADVFGQVAESLAGARSAIPPPE